MQEAWLSGPVDGVEPYLMPAAHALLQARLELEQAAASLDEHAAWRRPGSAAAAAYHLDHIAGSIGRLLTYARGEQLSDEQRAALTREGKPGDPRRGVAVLVAAALAAIDDALDVIRATPPAALLEPRTVGQQQLPTTLIGLLFHIAEHTQRHTGQLITTVKSLE